MSDELKIKRALVLTKTPYFSFVPFAGITQIRYNGYILRLLLNHPKRDLYDKVPKACQQENCAELFF